MVVQLVHFRFYRKKRMFNAEGDGYYNNSINIMGSPYQPVQGKLSRHKAALQRWSTAVFRRSQSSTMTLSNATERLLEGENSYAAFRDELLADYATLDN